MLMIAGGFVLGEVLILLHILTAAQVTGLFVLLMAGCIAQHRFKKSGGVLWWLLLFGSSLWFGSIWGQMYKQAVEAAELEIVDFQKDTDARDNKSYALCGSVQEISETEWDIRLKLRDLKWQQTEYGASRETRSSKIQGLLVICEKDSLASELKIGMMVSVTGEMELFPLPRNPGEFHSRNYYRGQKLNGRLEADSLYILDQNSSRLKEGLRQLRMRGSRILKTLVQDPEAGIFQAAVLGDKAELDDELNLLYSRNGISHLLALSGLHLSVLVSGCYRAARRCGAGYPAAGILGALLAECYVIMTGGSVSVIRAAVMLSCSFLAAWCGRTYDFLSAMGLAGMFILVSNPYQILQSGFQLSFGAIIGIGMVLPCFSGTEGSYLKQALSVSLSVQAVTLPITLFHFYQFSVYGIFLNLIVIPPMVFVITSGVAGIFFGAVTPGLGRFALGAGVVVLRLYEQLCLAMEKLPWAVRITGRPDAWQLIAYSMGLVLFVIFCGRRTSGLSAGGSLKGGIYPTEGSAQAGADGRMRGERESGGTGKEHWGIRLFWIQMFVLLSWQLLLCIQLPVPGVKVTFLDVGQGDGVCIQSGYTTILSDAGSSDVKNLGKYRLEPFLKQQGISVLDYVYVSHGDVDHISGIMYLLEEGKDICIRHMMLPAAGRESAAYEPLRQLVLAQGGEVHWIGAGDIRQIGDLVISCLYPAADAQIAEMNSQTLVLKAEYRDFRMLLTGDMASSDEEQLLADSRMSGQLSQISVLKIAHHGSRNSTSSRWLAAIAPRWAVVSYGKDNSYGHPHDEVVRLIGEQEIKLYRTAESGAITLVTDGERVYFRTYCGD